MGGAPRRAFPACGSADGESSGGHRYEFRIRSRYHVVAWPERGARIASGGSGVAYFLNRPAAALHSGIYSKLSTRSVTAQKERTTPDYLSNVAAAQVQVQQRHRRPVGMHSSLGVRRWHHHSSKRFDTRKTEHWNTRRWNGNRGTIQSEPSTTADVAAAQIAAKWRDAVHATRGADVVIQTVYNAGAATDRLDAYV